MAKLAVCFSSTVSRRTRDPVFARPERLALVLGVVTAGSLACTHHVRLTSPDTDPGARYVCNQSGVCRPADSDVPSDDNPSGTASITLPRECGGKVHQILIVDAGSDNPEVRVTCAPAEDPTGTMGEPEAWLTPGGR
jgi:hypothetical protein